MAESRSHPSKELEAYLQTIQVAERVPAGSSLKFCWVAEGKADIAGHVDDSLKCEIGAANCLGVINAIHAAPATVKDVSANYKAYLEKGGWKVEEKEVKSTFANGKAITGSHLAATNAGKSITVKVFSFGTDMVETRTYLAAMQ